MDMVKKHDWKTVEMPIEVEQFMLKKDLTVEDITCLKEGHLPSEMEDKWFVYWEDDKLYFHRSWTGFCIYIVSISSNQDTLKVIVNRNPQQYKEANVEKDKLMLTIQINTLLGCQSQNAELMKLYIKDLKL